LKRRSFLGFAAGFLSLSAATAEPSIPIIDTHIHLFDPRRPQGVPWPPKDNPILYKPALPDRYARLAEPLGVVGAIEIEASPWLEDNQWVLDIAAKNPIIVGTVGDLEPGKPEFRRQLERFHKNPLFLGIRYGNLWGRDLGARVSDPAFVADLKIVADAGLVLDTANPTPALIRDILRLTDRVSSLRVVMDHLPHLQPLPPDVNELSKRPKVYVKVSEVLQRVNGRVMFDPSYYRPVLDNLWDLFGEDRLLYGSDWPNSDPWGTYAQVLGVVRPYFLSKGRTAAEKFFWRNSAAAYRWIKRTEKQP
jgi:predicted TIM-barrel fold metal-dependent hydrolase